MTGESGVRRAEDIGGQELSYAEVKAIASGNPAVLTLAEADAELQRLAIVRKSWMDEQYMARRNVRELPEYIERLKKQLDSQTADMETVNNNTGITIGNRKVSDENAKDVLAAHLETLPEKGYQTRRLPLGVYRGLRFGLILDPSWAPQIYLDGAGTRQDSLSKDPQGPRAILNAIERLASEYGPAIASTQGELALTESQVRDYQARLGKPFLHGRYADELTILRGQRKVGLSGSAKEGEPTAADLAEKIKSLRATNVVEATPQRTEKRQVSAEE